MSKSNVMNTYNRFDVTFEKGLGCKLYDTHGKEYIDFVSGIAVNCLGHSHPSILSALEKQSQKLMHISNYYWNDEMINLCTKLSENSDHDKVFLCNSGTEAVEAALKIARKHGKMVSKRDKNTIIYMNNSFHGRTLGALSVTGQDKYQTPFSPLICNVKSVNFNDIKDLQYNFDDSVCGVIIEPIQGEGGINTVNCDYLNELKILCNKYNALLIFDEVQCGMGRLGTLFAYKKFNVIPDVICLAKALGGGFPIGAVLTKDKASTVFSPGDHGNTYGGNPLACAVSLAVLKELVDNKLVESVESKSHYLINKLKTLKNKYGLIKEIKGMGLLIGITGDFDVKCFVKKCFDKGLLLVTAGNSVIRFLPPLNIKEEDIDMAINILDKVMCEIKEGASL